MVPARDSGQPIESLTPSAPQVVLVSVAGWNRDHLSTASFPVQVSDWRVLHNIGELCRGAVRIDSVRCPLDDVVRGQCEAMTVECLDDFPSVAAGCLDPGSPVLDWEDIVMLPAPEAIGMAAVSVTHTWRRDLYQPLRLEAVTTFLAEIERQGEWLTTSTQRAHAHPACRYAAAVRLAEDHARGFDDVPVTAVREAFP